MSDLQRTTEWHLKRLGKPTASQFHRIKPGRNAKWSDATQTYMRELLVERLTGQWVEAYGMAIDWGNEHEDDARELYEARYGVTVKRESFAERDGLGGSPDGLVGPDGCIEIKCPYNSGNHIGYMLDGCTDHLPQIQANIYFGNRKWADFISYDPRFPSELQLYVIRVERDEQYIADLIARVTEFKKDLDELEQKVRSL